MRVKRTAVVTIEMMDKSLVQFVRDRRVTLATQVGSIGQVFINTKLF